MRRLLSLLLACVLVVAIPVAISGQPSSTGRHAAVSCAVTATAVVPLVHTRTVLVLHNAGTATIFVGNGVTATLTTANGVGIAAGATLVLDGYKGLMDCIVATGTQDLRFFEATR